MTDTQWNNLWNAYKSIDTNINKLIENKKQLMIKINEKRLEKFYDLFKETSWIIFISTGGYISFQSKKEKNKTLYNYLDENVTYFHFKNFDIELGENLITIYFHSNTEIEIIENFIKDNKLKISLTKFEEQIDNMKMKIEFNTNLLEKIKL